MSMIKKPSNGAGQNGGNVTMTRVNSVRVVQQGTTPKVTSVPAKHRHAETGVIRQK